MVPVLSFVPRPEMDLGDRRFQPARPPAAPPTLSVPQRSASQPPKPSSTKPSAPPKPREPSPETREAAPSPPDISVRRG